MSFTTIPDGTQIASGAHNVSPNGALNKTPPATLDDLIVRLETNPPKSFPMLGTTSSLIAGFLNLSLDEIKLDHLIERRTYSEHIGIEEVLGELCSILHGLPSDIDQAARSFGWRPGQSSSEMAWNYGDGPKEEVHGSGALSGAH